MHTVPILHGRWSIVPSTPPAAAVPTASPYLTATNVLLVDGVCEVSQLPRRNASHLRCPART